MSICIQGKEYNLAGIHAGDEEVIEVYSGGEKVWPAVADGGGLINLTDVPRPAHVEDGAVVEADEGYFHWLYMLDAIHKGETDSNCYLRFQANGVYFYIGKAPSGEQSVEIEGDTLKLTEAQKFAIAGQLGDKIVLEAKMVDRVLGWQEIKKGTGTYTWRYPIIDGTYFKLDFYATPPESWNYTFVSVNKVRVLPNDEIIALSDTLQAPDEGRYTMSTTPLSAVGGQNITQEVETLNGGYVDSQGKGIAMVCPAFEKTFELSYKLEF